MLARQNIKKRTINTGDHLFIVEGTRRWGLYDLKQETLIVIDSASGELLWALARDHMDVLAKLLFLSEHAPEVNELVYANGIHDRLFLPDTSHSEAIQTLEFLWLEVTDQCNHKCLHCYGAFCPLFHHHIDFEIAKRILRQARKFGCRAVQFVGGEPFLYKRLWELIEYAHALGFLDVEIFTNLTLLHNEDFDQIQRLGIQIATTLLGHNAQIHDACTQSPGSFNRWYRNMKKLQALGIPYRIGVIRMKQNESDMKQIEIFLRAENLLADDEPFEPDDVRPVGRGCNNAVEPAMALNYDFYFTVTPSFFHQARRFNPCWRGILAVSADGNVFPCVFVRDASFGNLQQVSMKTAITALQHQCWNITLDAVERCKDCEFRYACMDCRALSVNAQLGLYGRQPRCGYDPHTDT